MRDSKCKIYVVLFGFCGKAPDPHQGCLWTPLGDFRPPDLLTFASPNLCLLATPLKCTLRGCRILCSLGPFLNWVA